MKKFIPLLLILAACGSSEPKSPREEIARQQTELKREYKRLMDSAETNPSPSYADVPVEVADSIAKAQGLFNRRMTELKLKSDSLSNVMKAWEADSILRSK